MFTDVVYIKRYDFYLIYDSLKNIILKLDHKHNLSKYCVDIKGSRFPGRTMKVDKTERYLMINSLNKSIMIANLHPDSVETFLEAKNSDNEGAIYEFSDFVPLLNDRIATLKTNGLVTLWRFNLFKNEVNAFFDVKISRSVIHGIKENFVQMSICDQSRNIAISSTYGHLMNRSRILLAYVTEHDYLYLIGDKNLAPSNPINKHVLSKLE